MSKFVLKDAENIRKDLTKQQENDISMIYRQAYLKARKEMQSIPTNGTITQKLQRTYLSKLTKQLDQSYKSIGIGLEKEIEKQAKKAAKGVVENAAKIPEKYGFKIEGGYSFVPNDVVNALATGQVYGGNWSLSGAIWQDVNKHQSDINKIVAEGVAGNRSAYEIAQDIEKYVDPKAKKDWEWSKVYPGTAKKIDYNAQRLARTMVSHAYQQSLERVCKNNPFVDGFIWRSSHSARMCPICGERDGQFYKKGDLPLDHPNGMCTFEANIPESSTEIADRLADWVHGKDDAGLDKWYQDMNGGKMPKPTFNALQAQFLSPLGYSVSKMPKDFTEFANAMSYEQTQEFLKLAGGTWSNAHPYQIMEEYYNKNIASVRPGVTPIKIEHGPKPVNYSDWIAQAQRQTERHMLSLEQVQQSGFTLEQRRALRWYTGGAYKGINGYLRDTARGMESSEAIIANNLYEGDLTRIDEARAALNNTQLGEDLILRRGTNIGELAGFMEGDFSENKELLETLSIQELDEKFSGTVGTYTGFVSTSSMYDRGFPGKVECIIRAPANTKAASIMNISEYETDEGETLLSPGTKVKILKVEESDYHRRSNIRVFMEIIP